MSPVPPITTMRMMTSPSEKGAQQGAVEQGGLVIGEIVVVHGRCARRGARWPAPASEPGVELVLDKPSRVLAVGVEAEAEPAVADDVMDGAETVVGAAERCVEPGVAAIVVAAGWPELEQVALAHGRRQLGGVPVGLWVVGEHDSDGAAGLLAREVLVQARALVAQRGDAATIGSS